jgi:hypothetical protein
VTFTSPAVKLTRLTNKRDALPPPTAADKANGTKRIIRSEDLTQDTFNKLKSLHEDKRVSRAWSVEGQLKFIKAGDVNNIIHHVRSVYDPIDVILA